MNPQYQMCSQCVMDTTDELITFDNNGVCSHCHSFDREVKPHWFPTQEGENRLKAIIARIKEENKNKKYDSIIGLSGGVDSSYLALKACDLGLRPLALHVDAGWNTELAVNNIEKLINYCGWDLFTVVIDWEEMRDMQIAYLRSGVSNQDVPQDHAFFSALYGYAAKNKITYVLNGGNIATESIFPQCWQHSAMDAKNLKAIHKRFGKAKLRSFPIVSFWKYYFYFPFVLKMKVIRPLNFMPYSRKTAIKKLEQIGWRDYGRKHGESIFTKFFQNYYQPERFGFDKRKPHLSSLILAGEISRDEALFELKKPLYDDVELNEDKLYVQKKLGLTEEEFGNLLRQPIRKATEFPSNQKLYNLMKKYQILIQRRTGKRIATYS